MMLYVTTFWVGIACVIIGLVFMFFRGQLSELTYKPLDLAFYVGEKNSHTLVGVIGLIVFCLGVYLVITSFA